MKLIITQKPSSPKKARKMSRASLAMQSPDLIGNLPGAKSNLWSLKARQDIFERRQNGEDWETICKDYPTRTRHAMQQQYSVMKKQNAPDSPRFVSNRRGRRTRGTTRSKWATVNRLQSSSEDGLDSDQPFDVEMDEEDEEEFESDEPAAEESSHVADEDLAVVEDEASLEQSAHAPTPLGRSATEPSTSFTNLSRRATFPNLPGFAVPATAATAATVVTPVPVPEDKILLSSEQPKRKVNGEGTDSESRSSSHISKRRKYSTEPAEPVNPVPVDPMAPPKALSQSLNMNGMIFYPDAIAQAAENFRTLSRTVLNEQASRKDTFEAALRRANRRANDAEHRLQDMSQGYADKLKAKEEAHATAFDSLQADIGTLTASLAASRESYHALSESSRRAALDDKHAQIARLDELLPPLTAVATKLLDVRAQASSHVAAIVAQHEMLSNLIRQFLDNIEEVSMKRLKGYAFEIRDESQAMGERIREAKVSWEDVSELAQTFWNGFHGLVEGKGSQREEQEKEDQGTRPEPVSKGNEMERSKEGDGREEEREAIPRKEDAKRKDKTEEENIIENAKGDEIDLIQHEESQTQAEEDKKTRKSEETGKEDITAIAATREPDDRQLMEVDSERKSPGTVESKRHEGMII